MGGGYNIVASFLIFFFLFIYFTWFGVSMMIEKDKENKIKINPYDKLPLHRKFIDKKNKKHYVETTPVANMRGASRL